MNHINPKQLVILATHASTKVTTETKIDHSSKMEITNKHDLNRLIRWYKIIEKNKKGETKTLQIGHVILRPSDLASI